MATFYYKQYEVHRSIQSVEAKTEEEALEEFENGNGDEHSFEYACMLEEAGKLEDSIIPEKDYKAYDIDS